MSKYSVWFLSCFKYKKHNKYSLCSYIIIVYYSIVYSFILEYIRFSEFFLTLMT